MDFKLCKNCKSFKVNELWINNKIDKQHDFFSSF